MKSVHTHAPAKVNLGLAILGKRSDRYHEIDTIMAMIDLCDEITVSPRDEAGITITGMDEIPVDHNLMTHAARAWGNAANIEPAWQIDIVKRIPSPAGLGGGSSDAAAVLSALNTLYDHPLSPQRLHDLAASIGADCPFFLGVPCARATGIGTDLRPIEPPTGWLVLAIPPVSSEGKTASLYSALVPDDYSVSTDLDVIEDRITYRELLTNTLTNSFFRPALDAFPELRNLHQMMLEISGSTSLSGAGPALYAIARSRAEAEDWANQLREQMSNDIAILTAGFLETRPRPMVRP